MVGVFFIILVFLILSFLCWALFAGRTNRDQQGDDDAQEKFLHDLNIKDRQKNTR